MAHWQAPGRSTIAPFLIVKDPEAVIAFAVQVFGAELPHAVLRRNDGSLWNAELRIGDSTIMLSSGQGMECNGFIHVYVPDADDCYARALEAGAKPMMPVEDQFYGDRAGGVSDSQGNIWWIATHTQTLSEAELDAAARAEEARRGT